MKKIVQFTTVLMLMLPQILSAQFSPGLTMQPSVFTGQLPSAKTYIEASAVYDLNSTAFTNSVYNKYLYSNFIDEPAKNTVLPYLNDNNRFGAYAEQFVRFYIKPKKQDNLWLGLEVKNRRHYGVKFTDDAYKLVMYGNSGFAGKEAVLDNTKLFRINYQTINALASMQKGKYYFGGSLGFVHATRFIDVDINKGRVFTSFAGDSIAATADLTSSYANLRGDEVFTAGLGASVSLGLTYLVSEKSYLTVSVKDLGFVRFNNDSRTYTTNKTLSYRGYEATSFSQDFSPSRFEALPERINREVDSAEKKEAFTAMLPAQMHFMYSQYMGKKTRAVLGAEYFFNSHHLPGVHFNVLQEINPWLNIMGGVNVLGYGKFGVNLAISAAVKNFALTAGTEHAEAPLMPKNSFGQGGFVKLSVAL